MRLTEQWTRWANLVESHMVYTQQLRSGLVSAIKGLDHSIGRLGGRRRVLVEARIPVHFIVVHPVVRELMRDSRLDVHVTSDRREDLARTYEAAGLGSRFVSRERAEWMRFDLYMNGDPWYPAPLRRCARRLNFFHGVAGKYDLDQPPPELRLFSLYDRVAFVNTDRMRRHVEGGIVAPERAALVGYPKLDRLLSGAYHPQAVLRKAGLDPERPTVIYAPTWSYASSLPLAGEAIIATLLDMGVNVIAKLHDNCFLRGEKYGDVDWRERLRRFDASGRFLLATEPDSSPYLVASDLMITDHSSIGFEYLVLDRPLVIFDAPDLARVARINPEKVALLRSAGDVVANCGELREAVMNGLANSSTHSEERRRVAREMFHAPGTATSRALLLVYSLLGLAVPPMSAPAVERAGASAATARGLWITGAAGR